MYSNIVVTGEYVWASSLGVLGGTDVDLGTSNVNIDGADLEEGCSDLEEDGIPNLKNGKSQMVGRVNMSSNSHTRVVVKEKKEILLRFKLERRRRLELTFSCCQGGINYLRVYRLGVISLLCIWIDKAVVFPR